MSRTLILLGFAKRVNSSFEIPSMAREIRRNLGPDLPFTFRMRRQNCR
jgi:hypothetical protein